MSHAASSGDHADVVVVGGGPVGLLVASELALHGVEVTLVEANADVIDHPKAGTLQARALQLLRRRGYLPTGPVDAPADAIVQAPFHFAAQVRFPVTSPAIEGSPVVNVWQGEIERLLEAVCRSRGVR
ncbi:MAG: FAD-dependent oxidoreductase, partial [Solirubrobacteraceae bacterium]|nr:FAD-dependent oxidoreductase [Patulibacter sp.]